MLQLTPVPDLNFRIKYGFSTLQNVLIITLMLHTVNGRHWHTRLYLAALSDRPEDQLPELYLTRLGRFQSDGRFDLQQLPSSVNVHVIADGRGRMVARQRVFDVGAGDIFVFFPNQHIRYGDQRETPWRYTWFTLRGTRAESLLLQCGFSPDSPYRAGGRTPGLESGFTAVEEEFGQPSVSPLAAAALGWQLVRELEPHQTPQAPPSLATQARNLFDHQYGLNLSVDELAAKLNVSRSTLFRAFKEELGRSPKQVFDDLRMQKAEHLLRASTESVKEIAAACGYAGEAYFSRAFKARRGLPPGTWRRRQQTG